jgi:hypothetical protein
MRADSQRTFRLLFICVSALAFLTILLRAYYVPFTHDEASTFFFYVQTDNYMPYKAHAYTNNHVLNSFLTAQCYKLWGASPFVLRLPNILSFLVLVYGVYRFLTRCRTWGARLMLIAFFLLTFNLLDFFALCRGYGISFAFMVLGLSFMQDYFQSRRFVHLACFVLSWQIALAANLALIQPLLVLTALVVVFQAGRRLLFRPASLLVHAINAFMLFKWIKFALYYKKKGLFDSGMGSGFYDVSLKSLLDLLYGSSHVLLQGVAALLLAGCLFFTVRAMVVSRSVWTHFFAAPGIYLVAFLLLVLAFLLQQALFSINFPENRTVLFFYIFFALAVTFSVDRYWGTAAREAGLVLAAISLIGFVFSFNLSKFMYPFYHVMPERFMTYLKKEQQRSPERLTVGGHLNREMNYAFANYRAGGALNPMDVPAAMNMNCDYYYALEKEYQAFHPYYVVVFRDEWKRVLLKRKEPMQRFILVQKHDFLPYDTAAYYQDLMKVSRQDLNGERNVEAEVEITFNRVPRPWRAFLVMEVTAADGTQLQYKRMVLNWLGDDLTGQRRRLKITSSPLPDNYASLSVYLWNIDKDPVSLAFNKVTLSQLKGPGVGEIVPDSYYYNPPGEVVIPL